MPDPLSLIALGAAVGGATGKFVEKAWDSGEKWIKSYFKNHQETAKEQAMVNSSQFLNELAKLIKQMEEKHETQIEMVETAQDHPDFSIILHKAILSSAQSESWEKHKILAHVVAERLKSSHESMYSLISKLACDSIALMTTNQLYILGFRDFIPKIVNTNTPYPKMSKDEFRAWIHEKLSPYSILKSDRVELDILHLETISCISATSDWMDSGFADMDQELVHMTDGGYENGMITQSDLLKELEPIWDILADCKLLSVGKLIATFVNDQLYKTSSDFSYWR